MEGNLTGTYTKLRSGEWGVRIQGEHRKSGEVGPYEVKVKTKAGKVKTEVCEVFWSGSGISLATVQRREGPRVRAGSRFDARDFQRRHGGGGRPRFEEDEGSSFPCHRCGGYCYSGEHGYCPKERGR